MNNPDASRMHRLVASIERYHPPFRSEIEGCSAQEMDRLERLVGGSLPAPYVDFLSVMGRRMGGISLYDADFRLETLLDYYARSGPPEDLEEGRLTIATARYGPYGSRSVFIDSVVDLDCEDEQAPLLNAYPPVAREHEFPEAIRILDLVEPTLYEALFAKAFLQYHWSRFEHRQTLFLAARSKEELGEVASALEKFGFAQHPESDAVRYFERSDATLVLSPNPGEPVRLSLAAHEAAALHRLGVALSERLPCLQRGELSPPAS